jgi:DNA polymerase III epsilon subunit-like protein
VTAFAAVALCDRAFELLSKRGHVSEEELLAHVYGGAAPSALRERLAAPLLMDMRLERHADGSWSVRGPGVVSNVFTALAVGATGPSPIRARLVRIVALHVEAGKVLASFDVLLNPRVHVPKYVLKRIGVESDVLEEQFSFADIYDDLIEFLGARAVLAQEARIAWGFVEAEARRIERVVPGLALLDVNVLAGQVAPGKKPTLATIASKLGIAAVDLARPDEEARVIALVGSQLLNAETPRVDTVRTPRVLRRTATATALPDEPGVYVMRDTDQTALYVGKAARLRSRMQAYVHRPLGATRRMEGLVGAVEAVDTSHCESDVEALVLEDREIRRLQPRFNTVRQQHQPRYWIKLPPQRFSRSGVGKPLAPPRLELSLGPGTDEGEFVGPFRNETLAEQARELARKVFELDELRRADPFEYADRLQQAWSFLHGDQSFAEPLARRSVGLLRKVLAFDVLGVLLPADPRRARYVVLRIMPSGVIEGIRVDSAVVVAVAALDVDDIGGWAQRLLTEERARTAPEDSHVVLRWFGAQRPPARLVHLPEDRLAAADAIEVAALELLEARAARGEDPIDALG